MSKELEDRIKELEEIILNQETVIDTYRNYVDNLFEDFKFFVEKFQDSKKKLEKSK